MDIQGTIERQTEPQLRGTKICNHKGEKKIKLDERRNMKFKEKV